VLLRNPLTQLLFRHKGTVMAKINKSSEEHFDYLIVGAGPAGLQMGYFLQKAGRRFCILEREPEPGAFFTRFPRHRKLISINKVHTGYRDAEINLRWDWNSLLCDDEQLRFTSYASEYFPAADVMVRYLADFASKYRLPIRYGDGVTLVRREGNFVVGTQSGKSYRAARLIVAAGLSRPYLPSIAGIALAERYDSVSVDPAEFTNQRVLVIGKANSGFETAENLINTAAVIHLISPHPIRMAWKTHFVGHLRAVNNNFLDTYQLKCQNAVLDGVIRRIERDSSGYKVSVAYSHAQQEEETLSYDRVILCAGFEFDFSIFDDSCRPDAVIDNRFPKQTSSWESVNVPGLFFAGNIMQMRDFKKTNSGFIHGFRYNVRALHRMLEERYEGSSWPCSRLSATTETLAAAIEQRINRTSALWQQFGFLCDLAVLDGEEEEVLYCEEYPIDYVHDQWRNRANYLLVGLEFGKIEGDPFSVKRNPDPRHAMESTFLHPVVRYFKNGELAAEHHMLEDLSGEWRKEEVHLRPLREFLKEVLSDQYAARKAAVSLS
jgi:thioredoxin reductase